NPMDLPIACTLTEEQLRERRREMLELFRANASEPEALPDGYVYTFRAAPNLVADIARFVDLERECCEFLTFKIIVAPRSAIRLEITGPPNSKAMIADLFGS